MNYFADIYLMNVLVFCSSYLLDCENETAGLSRKIKLIDRSNTLNDIYPMLFFYPYNMFSYLYEKRKTI